MLAKIKAILKSDYLLGRFMRLRYERRFYSASNSNLFYGIFSDFQSASSNLPDTKPSGYDNKGSAEKYKNLCTDVRPEDYPALYWYKEIASPQDVIWEVGGHIGVSFYAFDRLMGLGDDIQWTIYDVEAVVHEGRTIAQSREEKRLKFSYELEVNKATNIVFAFGSLQYIEHSLVKLIEIADISPEHVLVNLLPVNDKPEYYTINNIGTAFCPYKITNSQQLIEDMSVAGYDLIDSWLNPNKRCVIPFQKPSYSLNSYKGFYFKKRIQS